MWIPVNVDPTPTSGSAPGRRKKGQRARRRRAATAMEYLVCITFVLVALIMAVNALGLTTSKIFSSNAKATSVK